jgi:hypothetical protein
MIRVVLLSTLIVGAMLLPTSFDHVRALPLARGAVLGWGESASDLIVKVKFKCWRVEGKLVCGKTKTDQPKDGPKPAPVEQPCPLGMIGKQPNCECPDGTYFAAYVGCVPVIPTAPAPSAPPPSGPKEHYCVTCGGPGCLQKAPACPSGGLTTCTDVPGQTYYNCCCN